MSTTHSHRPATFLLVHGAWHGAWCWKKLIPLLEAAGHQVLTCTQTGLAERSHLLSNTLTLDTFVQDVVNLIRWEELSDLILVGHSFGGNAISGAADQVPDAIRHLVYLDALVLQNGQSPFSIMPKEVADHRRKIAMDSSDGLSIPVPDASAFGVNDPADKEWLHSKLTPHPLSVYEDTLKLSADPGNGLPATYIAVTPHYLPTTSSRDYAKTRKDWRYVEMEAGHDAMVTSPEALARILLSLC